VKETLAARRPHGQDLVSGDYEPSASRMVSGDKGV
jgi:hypothetical protein